MMSRATGSSGPVVAVVDVGSNTIKLLVARGPEPVTTLAQHTLDVRLGTGLGTVAPGERPRLGEAAIAAGTAAIAQLLDRARPWDPGYLRVVATSAVRDSVDGPALAERVRATTGETIRILSGDEEALANALGVAQDPALAAFSTFTLVDLGGGSMQLLQLARGQPPRGLSLPLGAVRLTVRWTPDQGQGPLASATLAALAEQVRNTVVASGFAFAPGPVVVTGGAATHARAMLAAARGLAFADWVAPLPVAELRAVTERLAALPAAARAAACPGLPPARADIFPTALVTLTTVAALAGVAELHHSLFNLRYGVAAALLRGALGGE